MNARVATAAASGEADMAWNDLTAIAELGPKHPDLLETLSGLIDEGTSVLQIDRFAASSAGDEIVRYKLADELGAVLAAVRARNVDADEIKGCAGHDGSIPETGAMVAKP